MSKNSNKSSFLNSLIKRSAPFGSSVGVKTVAIILYFLLLIGTIISSIVFFFADKGKLWWVGVIILIAGLFVSYAIYIVLFAFGELVENSRLIRIYMHSLTTNGEFSLEEQNKEMQIEKNAENTLDESDNMSEEITDTDSEIKIHSLNDYEILEILRNALNQLVFDGKNPDEVANSLFEYDHVVIKEFIEILLKPEKKTIIVESAKLFVKSYRIKIEKR